MLMYFIRNCCYYEWNVTLFLHEFFALFRACLGDRGSTTGREWKFSLLQNVETGYKPVRLSAERQLRIFPEVKASEKLSRPLISQQFFYSPHVPLWRAWV
jgi:hypothetical protein